MRLRRRNYDVVDERASVRNPARYVAAVIGIAAILFGAFALAETGLDTDSLRRPHESIWTFHHTPLLAVAEIGFGVVMLVAAFGTYIGRALMLIACGALLGFGVIIIGDWWPNRIHSWFGVHERAGWLYAIVGAVGVAAAVFLPVTRHRRVVERETVPDDSVGVSR
jgi:hypothetical protein